MTMEIRDPSLEARIQKQIQTTGSSSVEEVLLRLLDSQEDERPTLTELRKRLHRHKPVDAELHTARLIREQRGN